MRSTLFKRQYDISITFCSEVRLVARITISKGAFIIKSIKNNLTFMKYCLCTRLTILTFVLN